MISARPILRFYLEGLLGFTGGKAAALFVPGSANGADVLLQVGAGEQPSELVDLASARASWPDLERRAAGLENPVELAGREDDVVLLRTTARAEGLIESVADPSLRRRGTDQAPALGPTARSLWVGLRLARPSGAEPGAAVVLPLQLSDDVAPRAWPWLLAVGGALVWQEQRVSELLDDSVTGLPGRLQFQDLLGRALARATERETPLSLLLVNPDDFDTVNVRRGRAAGDLALAELGHLLGTGLRTSDVVARYGAAVFAVILPGTGVAAAEQVAEKVRRLVAETSLLGEIELGCSVGLFGLEAGELGSTLPDDMIRCASRALNAAKLGGGNRVQVWGADADTVGEGVDRLRDIFTGDPVKDYRNMSLLWGSIRAVASSGDERVLASQAVEHLMRTLSPKRALVAADDGEQRRFLFGLEADDQRQLVVLAPELVPAADQELMRQAQTRRAAVVEAAPDGSPRAAFPLAVDGRCLGSIGLTFDAASRPFDAADAFFLEALASQLAVALDRARLVARESARQEDEKRRLEQELNQLRDALEVSQLLFRSAEMEGVLATVRRVAPTDATVLIEGESGTGKELLARALHELSPRGRKSLVVVDCGSIPPTLVESELFGHERGAYTGATQRRVGRLSEANGSTLFLDEIGELPLEVQAKLLRFVQERHFTPVGGNRPVAVEVRIIAATNRNLLEEVAAGRFREDLYYRLKVVSLEAPPLRKRPEDILYLAQHFLQRYGLLYGKRARALTPEAEALLLQYSWPGNVRELQNRMMQAVILSESEELAPDDLRIAGGPGPVPVHGGAGADRVSDGVEEEVSADPWFDLERLLVAEVDRALGVDQRVLPGLGRWLREDLVLAADRHSGGNARQAAGILRQPETSVRRRIVKANDQRLAGLAIRSPGWPRVVAALERIVAGSDTAGSCERSEDLLLGLIDERVPNAKTRGAALLGVTPPTYGRRLAALARARAAEARRRPAALGA